MEYTRLGKSGLKVSKIILGTMSFGDPKLGMGWTLPEAEALPIIKHAYDKGVNTWDCADVYSMGDAERIIGSALATYSIPRKSVVILTKCYGGVFTLAPGEHISDSERFARMTSNSGVMVNQVGLSRKHIFDAVDDSVARLGTYIDVLQVHRLDRETDAVEIMRALNDVVESGKVRYLGASSMKAHEFQHLQNIAQQNGWHTFISMQPYHSLLYREEERELLAYCAFAGVGVIPWSPLARGRLARPLKVGTEAKTAREETDAYSDLLIGPVTEADVEIIKMVETMAREKGMSMATIALAWSLEKGVSPIVGVSSNARLDEAVAAVQFVREDGLTEEDVRGLDAGYVAKTYLEVV